MATTYRAPAGPSSAAASAGADDEAATGSQVLTVDEYSKTKESLGVGGCIRSSRFRAGGHGWYVECYPCGEDKEVAGWVSVILRLDHRGAAEVQVKARYQLALLNHAGGEIASFRNIQTFSCLRSSAGYDFVDAKDLESSPLLLEDGFQVRCDLTIVKKFTALRPPDLHRHLGGLLASQVGGDVTFLIGGELLTAHRCVLTARSTVFMAELFGPGREQNVATHVWIDDMEPRVFKALLHFIYTDSYPEVNEGDDRITMAQGLLVAADRYGMQRFKLICEDVLCVYVDARTAVTMLELAEKHGCHRLKDACIKILKDLLARVAP